MTALFTQARAWLWAALAAAAAALLVVPSIP